MAHANLTDAPIPLFTLASAPAGGGGGGFAVPGASGGTNGGEAGTVQPGAADPNGTTAPPSMFGGGNMVIFLIMGFMVFLLISSALAGRKQKKQRAEMLSSLGKHDKVQTVGGIIGTVAEIREDEMILKVDEGSNTRIRVARSAVQTVLKVSRDHDSGDDAASISDEAA